MTDPTMRLVPFLIAGLALSVAGCHTGKIDYPAVPPVSVTSTPAPTGFDYTQKQVVSEKALRKRVAIARFEDNLKVSDSPFGQKRTLDIVAPNVHVQREDMKPEGEPVSSRFSEKLIDALAQTKRFILIERKDINAILREISFGETKWVDKNQSAKVGKIVGAQIIVTGSIGPNDDPAHSGEGPIGLLLRMYDVETSRIVGTARAFGGTEQEVIDRAVSQIVLTMDKIPWTGKIASVTHGKFYLNAGTAENVQVGDTFRLFSLGNPILDPDSKEILGYQEEPAGEAKVVAVTDRVATLEPAGVSKRPIRVGDKAQPAAP
ncbi:MAG TPA: CsgG/HfaB family protein [Bdellovibrionota bacterium]|nr:CsgG/HfaB family protein [Bdellovibrionota bacterium]